jgi:DNA-directed RNA polymerase subunit L
MEKIHVSIINHDKTIGNTRLEVRIKGSIIDYIPINTIRRSILSYVPIYAFTEFKFEKNTSIFNNNYIKLRLINMPVWGINNTNVIFKEEKHINKTVIDEVDDETNDTFEEKFSETTKSDNQLTMYVHYKNDTTNNISVTTNNAKFYYNNKQIVSPYLSPIPIVDLQPRQEIGLSATTTLNIEDHNAIFSPVSTCSYKQLNENDFELYLSSRGQITEHQIIHVAIDNIIDRINNINTQLKDNNNIDNLEGIININNEDHTIGNLLSRGLQLHKNISFGGYRVTHPLNKQIELHYKLKNKGNINNIMKDVINTYTELFTKIKNLLGS